MAKINVNVEIEVNDKELEKLNLTPEQYAESLTSFDWKFESPALVICQDVDHEEFGDKIAEKVDWSIYSTSIMNEKMDSILVSYEVISGDWSAQSTRSFRLEGRRPEDVIHDYFRDFWGEDTEVETKGSRYHHNSWEQAVKISSIRTISDEEMELLEKLGI